MTVGPGDTRQWHESRRLRRRAARDIQAH